MNQSAGKMTKMESEIMIPDEMIMNKILLLRGEKVMISNDLAVLYGVTTKRLNEQVKRNIKRFPKHFMFQLTEQEKDKVVANCDHLQNLKYSPYLPYVFTEHEVLQLANVLRNVKAVQVSIKIIEAFIYYRISRYANYSLNFLLLIYICIIIAYRDMQ